MSNDLAFEVSATEVKPEGDSIIAHSQVHFTPWHFFVPFPELFSQPCQRHSSILWHADNNIVITNVWDYWYDQSTGFTKDCKDWPGDAWRHLVSRTNNYTLKSLIDLSFIGQQVMKFVCMCFHIIEIFVYIYSHVYLSKIASQHYSVFHYNLHLGKYILMLFSVSFDIVWQVLF